MRLGSISNALDNVDHCNVWGFELNGFSLTRSRVAQIFSTVSLDYLTITYSVYLIEYMFQYAFSRSQPSLYYLGGSLKTYVAKIKRAVLKASALLWGSRCSPE